MEQNFSVLLYSKYSDTSKQIMNAMNSSGVDFFKIGLQNLCIDNKEIRNRIIQNKQINITSVPCILVVFSDGIIEKYEGVHCFKWIDEIISSDQVSNKNIEIQKHIKKQIQHNQIEDTDQNRDQSRDRDQNRDQSRDSGRDQNRDSGRDQNRDLDQNRDRGRDQNSDRGRDQNRDRDQSSDQSQPETKHNKKIKKQNNSLEPLEFFKSIPKPIARIREDSGNYSQINDLFKGEEPDVRKSDGKIAINKNSSNDVMNKAKELAKMREDDTPPPPVGHPASKLINNT